MLDFLLTFGAFLSIILAIPLFLLSSIVLKISRFVWLLWLALVYPDIEFVRRLSIRSLLDTYRNQGIISVLLAVKGQADPEACRRHLQELVKRRDKSGNVAFPRLRHCLVTRCGTYGWKKEKFDLDQNLSEAPGVYRGRAVTEYNIQDYVSEIVSKYLPPTQPPWQMIIIPTAEDQHYILVKLHHVLLSEGLNIGDLLPLIPPTRQTSGVPTKSPLVKVLHRPEAIPQLKDKILDTISNRWNEFVANYDPLECPKLLNSYYGFFEYHAIALVTIVAVWKACRKGFRVIKNDWWSRSRFIYLTIWNETDKRGITLPNYVISIFVTLNPINLLALYLKYVWSYLVTFPFRFPGIVYSELVALKSCFTEEHCKHPDTWIGGSYVYIKLGYEACKEMVNGLVVLFYAPRLIIQEILMQKDSFPTVTLCGRKSVAWSLPVPINQVKKTARISEGSELEVMLTALASCITRYLVQTHHLIPENIPVTVRNVNSNYIYATGTNIRPEDSISGLLCLNLPIPDPEEQTTIIGNLLGVQASFWNSLEKQRLSHLLSLFETKFGILTNFVPAPFLKIYLKYLSRKYAVSIVEVTSRYPNVKQKTLWGQEVAYVLYWQPPQGNTSVSLCLNEYGEHVRLAVMCDAQLSPHHSTLIRDFPELTQEIHKACSIDDN